MTAAKWKNKLKKSCVSVGTYKPEFDTVISTLADILETRDGVYEQFVDEGSEYIIGHTNKGGRTNPAKNPLVVLWQDLNAQRLTYRRDLGLTPSGLKKLTDESVAKGPTKLSLFDAISKRVE